MIYTSKERFEKIMKILRIAGLSLFLLSVIAFTGYRGYKAAQNDYTAPVIKYEGDRIYASVKESKEELLRDVKAIDSKDGDVTDSLLIESVSDFISPGERIITYAAFDSGNNIAKSQRRLVYTDYVPPKFTLSEPLRFAQGDAVNLLKNLRVEDCLDGDLSASIKYEESDYYIGSSEGTYTIEFKVTNSAGDTSCLPAEVEFYNPVYNEEIYGPKIVLKDYLVYLKKGETFQPDTYLKSVIIDKKEYGFREDIISWNGQLTKDTLSKKNISVISDVNTSKPGAYQAEYSMQAQNGYKGTTKLLVVVEE